MSHHWLPRPARVGLLPAMRELGAVPGLLKGGSHKASSGGRGGGPPVLLVPGFLAGDDSLDVLAAHVAAAGFRPHAAGLPRNVDCSEATVARLIVSLERAAALGGRRVAIVGHSRGGLLARVLAHRRPDLVSGVVALATPHRAPLAINPVLLLHAFAMAAAGSAGVGGLVRWTCAFGGCCAAFRRDLAAPLAAGLDYVTVYSRRDGVVDWRACLEPTGREIEVPSGHCEMASHPVTLQVVSTSLTRFAGVLAA